MNRRILFNALYLLPLLMMALSFASCSDDDDDLGGENSANSHIGKWFLDWSSPEKTIWTEMDFDAKGNYSSYQIISSIKEGINVRHKVESTYYRENNALICQEDWTDIGGNYSTERYDIVFVDKYTLILGYAPTGSEETYSRIVDEYYVTVGESIPFRFEDGGFANAVYSVTDERIAQIDNNGNITAIKHGVTYITARTSSGAVTVKVHVVDFEQPYTEYGADLTLTKKQIIEKYGNDYFELKSDNEIVYYVGNFDTEAVNFKFTRHDKVEIILATLWDRTYVTEMAEYFKGKYEMLSQKENSFYGFYNTDDKCSYFITTDLEHKLNGYVRIMSDFEQYDDLIVNGSADELAAQFGYTITKEDGGYCFINVPKGNMYKGIRFRYDEATRKTKWIQCFLRDGLSLSKATEMVQEFYPYYEDGLGYCASESWWTLSPIVFVEADKDEDSGEVFIRYSKL